MVVLAPERARLVTLHDGVPVPKVIDFGVAKALGEQLTEKTLFTNFAQMVGTPLYMSPEQALLTGLDVDTHSDIYSLGRSGLGPPRSRRMQRTKTRATSRLGRRLGGVPRDLS
jgi:serine/threonine protein kinase